MPAKAARRSTRVARAARKTGSARSSPARRATPTTGATPRTGTPPAARRRTNETAKAPVKAARSSYKPKTAGPTSTESERLLALHARLDRVIRQAFPRVEGVFDYGMHGWRMPRLRRVEWTTGTIDPNFVVVGVAERANGITLHLWNPLEWDFLESNKEALSAAGFKVMKGCVQFTRKTEYPVAAIEALLDRVARQVKAEG